MGVGMTDTNLTQRNNADWLDSMVTVCDECLRASCWQGRFYCERYKSAGTMKMPRARLEKLALEHPSYWAAGETLTPRF